MRRSLHVGVLTAMAAACAGGIRPAYTPFPEAIESTAAAPPAEVVTALVSAMAAEGLRVQWQSEVEGFVESQWYDVFSRESGSFNRTTPERFIRLRFFVDPQGDAGSRIVAEVAMMRTVDPSVMERDAEMMAPTGHAGRRILDDILRRVSATR